MSTDTATPARTTVSEWGAVVVHLDVDAAANGYAAPFVEVDPNMHPGHRGVAYLTTVDDDGDVTCVVLTATEAVAVAAALTTPGPDGRLRLPVEGSTGGRHGPDVTVAHQASGEVTVVVLDSDRDVSAVALNPDEARVLAAALQAAAIDDGLPIVVVP